MSSVPQPQEQHLQEGDGQVAVGSGAVTTYTCGKAKASETRGIGKILEMVAQTGRRDTENSIILLLEGSVGWYRVVSSKQGAGERELHRIFLAL